MPDKTHHAEPLRMEVLPPEGTSADSREIAAINGLHRRATGLAEEARSKAEEATHFALLCGTRLEALKASVPHGEWGTLFNDQRNPNVAHIGECATFEFSSFTARRYMEVAKRIRMDRSLSGRAQKTLTAIAHAPEIDDEAREFLNKITKGQTLRQLYLDLDIITAPPAKTKPAPEPPAGPKKSKEQALLEDAREQFFTWRESWEHLMQAGYLEWIDREGLLELKEFIAHVRDRINARLK